MRKSHGKMRPSLPRSADLQAVPAAPEPRRSREANGRFTKGNAIGRGRGWKRAIAKMLGRDVDDLADVATTVAEDAWRLFTVALKELPNDGSLVRSLVARKAQHEALEGYYTAHALAKLGTPAGDAAEAKATMHGTRAERLTISAIDVATRLAVATQSRPRDYVREFALAAATAPQPSPEPEDEDPSPSSQDGSGRAIEPEDDPEPVQETKTRPEPSSGQVRKFGKAFSQNPSAPHVDPEVPRSVSPEERARVANEERRRLLGLCPHDVNASACPECWQTREQERLAGERQKLRKDQQ